jgi:hypothetical protein
MSARRVFALPCYVLEASSLGQGRTGVGWRVVGILLAPALAFGCAVMLVAMSDIGSTPTCHEISIGKAASPSDGECFSGSSLQKAITLGLGWPSGGLAGVAGLAALAFVITGRRGRLALQLAALGIVLGGLSILIGSV